MRASALTEEPTGEGRAKEEFHEEDDSETYTSEPLPVRFPAGVTFGQPLTWRTLRQFSEVVDTAIEFRDIFVGNFEGDSGQELLFEEIASNFERSMTLRNPDGVEATYPYVIAECVWDYDGDGRDELIVDRLGLQALALDQSVVGQLTNTATGIGMENILIGDLDGKGGPELIVPESGEDHEVLRWRAFASGPNELYNSGEWRPFDAYLADADGDGRNDLIGTVEKGESTFVREYTSLRGSPAALPRSFRKFGSWFNYDPVRLDLPSGQLLANSNGMLLDVRNGTLRLLDPPPGYFSALDMEQEMETHQPWRAMRISSHRDTPVVPLEMPDQTLLGGVITPDSTMERHPSDAETFALWTTEGALAYSENMGEPIDRLLTLRDTDDSHVVLLTRSRLMIWP